MQYKRIDSLVEIADQYNLFLIDVGGVIHDGVKPYPYSIQTLKFLQDKGKKVIIFTNAPRPKAVIKKKIEDFGHTFKDEDILTSGDFFNQRLDKYKDKVTYVLGMSKNRDLHLDKKLKVTEDITKAESIIILEYLSSKDNLNQHDEIFKYAVEKKLPAICPNPDAIVNFGDEIRHPAGFFANKYIELGGEVEFFGKPHLSFYEEAVRIFPCDKPKILGIGDNLHTDILGANHFNIDSLLITEGIYYNDKKLSLLFDKYKISPCYICEHLKA
jgi:HAD superfamily hydrolase (TIGR01459 family)